LPQVLFPDACRRSSIRSPECRSRSPLTLNFAATTPSSPVNVFEPSLHGEHLFPSFLVSGTHRCTGACTPARPAPPPFGVGRCGRPNPRSEPLDVCASSPATRSTHPQLIWLPGTPSQARAGEAPPPLSLSRRACRHLPLAGHQGRAIAHGRS
jgi:hypothetical protein